MHSNRGLHPRLLLCVPCGDVPNQRYFSVFQSASSASSAGIRGSDNVNWRPCVGVRDDPDYGGSVFLLRQVFSKAETSRRLRPEINFRTTLRQPLRGRLNQRHPRHEVVALPESCSSAIQAIPRRQQAAALPSDDLMRAANGGASDGVRQILSHELQVAS